MGSSSVTKYGQMSSSPFLEMRTMWVKFIALTSYDIKDNNACKEEATSQRKVDQAKRVTNKSLDPCFVEIGRYCFIL